MRLVPFGLALVLAACGGSSRTTGEPARAVPVDATDERPVETELRRFPGVDVRETADGVIVRLRPTSSFMATGDPLYVVDGAPRAAGPGGALVGIRRVDIADIRVLRSAAEVAEYGPRGANGVVVVTTRAGGR